MPGKFYNGNREVDAKEVMTRQGSQGLEIDQGWVRLSYLPQTEYAEDKSEVFDRLKVLGSHAHLQGD